MTLANKNIIVGITGSIAAYKSADLVRRLRDAGATVRVVMTKSACEFITPLTMQAVSGNPVHDDLFDREAEAAMGHIELARWADLVLIAPASADLMARLANGNADDLITTLCLATRAPIAIAPAMNQAMWHHESTQDNANCLQKKDVKILGPAAGEQACGDIGFGRMLEPSDIVAKVGALFATEKLAGLRVLVTAGPTHEAMDPVRYVTNGSSGKMGFALAGAAAEAGASVTLVSGPVHLETPPHVERIDVVTALDMHDAVMSRAADYDMVFAVAAVSDYRSESIAAQKIHKDSDVINVKMIRNPDIAASVGALTEKPFLVGFAAETEHVAKNAKAKRQRKHMNMIVANAVCDGMGSEDNSVIVIDDENETLLPRTSKHKLAGQLVEMIADNFSRHCEEALADEAI